MTNERKIHIQRQTAYDKIQNGTEPITYSDCILAIEYDGQIISSISPELITEELCLAALNNNYLNKNLIKYIPKKSAYKEIFCFHCSNKWRLLKISAV